MSKKNIIIIAVVVLLVIGGGLFFVLNSSDSDKQEASSTKSAGSSSSTGQEQTEKSSIKSISAGGKPRECTMSYSGSGGTGTGTIYTDGKGNARMQMNLKTEQNNIGETNQIVKNNMAYSWFNTNGQTIGMVIDLSKTSESSKTAGSSTGPTPDQNFDMKCKSWNVDESKFTLPNGVNFMDMSSTTPPVPTAR